jgi:hypothetical protein
MSFHTLLSSHIIVCVLNLAQVTFAFQSAHLLFPQEFIALRNARTPFLRSRRTQYLLSFSYWPQIKFRPASNIYEIRSYTLKPGTMIEWGNNWARGINHRTGGDAPYAGFFSQIGVLYQVHHIWSEFLKSNIMLLEPSTVDVKVVVFLFLQVASICFSAVKKGLILEEEAERRFYPNELDVRKPLVKSP